MTEQQSSGGFAKAFVPGLVLGIVIGAFAGATLPALLAKQKLPEHNGTAATGIHSDRDREEFPPDVAGQLEEGDESAALPEDSAGVDDQVPPTDDTGADDTGSDDTGSDDAGDTGTEDNPDDNPANDDG